MAVDDISRSVQVLVILFSSQLGQVLSEYCGANLNCYFPEKCCSNGMTCCYDSDRSDRLFTYKLHVWNMWYFWFIIIFIMMSCFGGCGYYRRKRMAAITRIQRQRGTVVNVPPTTDYLSRHHTTNNYIVYTGPGLDSDPTSYSPPPYSEVVSQPGMYPPNKSELPPYPGAPVITADTTGNSSLTLNVQDLNSQIPQPPPYSEVIAEHNRTRENTTNSSSSSTDPSQPSTDPSQPSTDPSQPSSDSQSQLAAVPVNQ